MLRHAMDVDSECRRSTTHLGFGALRTSLRKLVLERTRCTIVAISLPKVFLLRMFVAVRDLQQILSCLLPFNVATTPQTQCLKTWHGPELLHAINCKHLTYHVGHSLNWLLAVQPLDIFGIWIDASFCNKPQPPQSPCSSNHQLLFT